MRRVLCKRKISLFSLILLFSCALAGYGDYSSDLLQKVLASLSHYTDYQNEIRETSRIRNAAGIQTTSGTIKITEKNNLFYIDNTFISGGIERHIIQLFDSRRFWYYDVHDKLVQKVELFKIPKQLRDSIRETLQKQNFTIPEAAYNVRESSYQSKAVYIFELKEKRTINNQVYEKVLFIADKETLLPVKQEMTVKIVFSSGEDEKTEISIETTREYTNWKTDTGIPDYKFVLALPDDVRIIDVSQETKEKLLEMFPGM